MPDSFQDNLSLQDTPAVDQENPVSDEEVKKEIEGSLDNKFYSALRKTNNPFLIRLTGVEKDRIARRIKDWYNAEASRQEEISSNMDAWDDTYRMKNRPRPGDDEDTPTYTSPLSTVALEVIHASIMNVFFTPKDPIRVLPTEEGDVPKVEKLNTFSNWSVKNELNLFEQCDKLFHASDKNGECPYVVHWVKEYGTEIKIEPLRNPVNPQEVLLDEVTGEPLTQEREVTKLLYNGPKLEIFSRKDYIFPASTLADKTPTWEMRKLRMSADAVLRKEKEGVFYQGTFDNIINWGQGNENDDKNKEGDIVPLGRDELLFVEFYGRIRINALKKDEQGDDMFEELEDEFIGVVELSTATLCSLRKNKFPLKMRPIGLDVFIPDDEGRKRGTGVIEMMESLQRSYDLLKNQFIFATVQSNSPMGFFTPLGNMRDEKIKLKPGWLYPTSDPNSVKFVQIPAPNNALENMLEIIRNWAQLLFGISDYSAGVESKIDPSAPAKKAQLVVAQGSVRLNLIIRRKNKTLKDIVKRWFLLYQANMPENKFMRIVGDDKKSAYNFVKMDLSDFALKSIPDFEFTGNVLNSNKGLEVQKSIAIYQLLSQNPFFNPQTKEGLQALRALTKWLMDKLDEVGISSFLPDIPGDNILTPEEENARMLQGDVIEPNENEDHIYHIQVVSDFIDNPSLPDEIRSVAVEHRDKHIELLKALVTKQTVFSNGGQGVSGASTETPGGINAGEQGTVSATPGAAGQVFPGTEGVMGGFAPGNNSNITQQ